MSMYNNDDENMISRDINEKSFILSGDSFIDIKNVASFTFINDPDGYIYAIYYMIGSAIEDAIATKIANRNELSQLFLQLEHFFDDPILKDKLMPLINKIEMLKLEDTQPKKHSRSKK